MMSWHNWYIALLLLICCIICQTESRYRDRDRDRDRKRADKNGRMYSSPISSSSSSSSSSSIGFGASSLSSSSALSSSSSISSLGGVPMMPSTTATINLCSRDRDMKLLCYCSPDDFMNNVPALKADCRVLEKDFPENDLTWLAFQQQKSLRHLKLTVQKTGYMDYIPTKYLELLTNLTTLSIEYSQVLIVKSFAFANLQNLEKISLIKNLINIIDKDGFSNHIQLKELYLVYNQISEIDRYAFRNLPILEKLYLTANNISNLHEEIFSELGKLLELKLDQNIISVLTRDVFKGLGNLKTLKLTHNNLNFIGDTVFSELWSLQELELDDNRIERISERALDGLNNLKTLNLRNNQLKKLDNGVLRGVPALLSINLQENSLETLTYNNIQPIMENLMNSGSELSVSDNRFVCDCRLEWMYDLRNRTRNLNLKLSLEEIECWLHYGAGGKTRTGNKPGVSSSSSSSSGNDVSLNMIKNRVPNTSNGGIIGGGGVGGVGTGINGNIQKLRSSGGGSSIGTGIGVSGNEKRGIDRKIIYPSGNHDNTDFDNEYYDGEIPQPYEIDTDGHGHIDGQIVELFKLTPDSLPCPEELHDPTELPLSRESIGMDVRTTHVASSSSSSCSSSMIHFDKLLMCISLKSLFVVIGGTVGVIFYL